MHQHRSRAILRISEQFATGDPSLSQMQLSLVACPKCGALTSHEFDTSQHVFCENCGYVLTNSVLGPDAAHSHSSHTIQSATSQNPVLRISDLTTRWVSVAKASDQTQRNFSLALSEVTRIVLQLKLSKEIALRASEPCRAAFERHLTRGKKITTVSAGAVYAACRLSSVPMTINE